MAVVVSIGKKGVGKSTAMRRLAYRLLQHRPESVIFWHDPGLQLRGGRVFSSIADARAAFAAQGLPRLSIFRGADVDVDGLARLALDVHDVVLVLDELDRACSGKEWRSQAVKKIVHEGRAERVDLWGTFRFTRNVNEDIIGAADVVLVFHHSSASLYDLQMLRQRFGLEPQQVIGLPPKAFILWSDDSDEVDTSGAGRHDNAMHQGAREIHQLVDSLSEHELKTARRILTKLHGRDEEIAARNARDVELINAHADELRAEMDDILSYQVDL